MQMSTSENQTHEEVANLEGFEGLVGGRVHSKHHSLLAMTVDKRQREVSINKRTEDETPLHVPSLFTEEPERRGSVVNCDAELRDHGCIRSDWHETRVDAQGRGSHLGTGVSESRLGHGLYKHRREISFRG